MPEPSPPTFDAALLDATVHVPDHVVFRTFVAETVVLNIETCRYHGLNPTGGRMLEALSERGEVGAVAEQIAAEYGAPLERVQADLVTLCQSLADQGLLEIRREGAS